MPQPRFYRSNVCKNLAAPEQTQNAATMKTYLASIEMDRGPSKVPKIMADGEQRR